MSLLPVWQAGLDPFGLVEVFGAHGGDRGQEAGTEVRRQAVFSPALISLCRSGQVTSVL